MITHPKISRFVLKRIIFLFIIFIFNTCNLNNVIYKKNDVYEISKKGHLLSFSLFKSTVQLVKKSNNFFILYKLYNYEEDVSALHLLVCDTNLILKGAAYTTINFIENIIEDSLIVAMTPNKNGSKGQSNIAKLFRNDLPSPIKYKLYYSDNFQGFQNRSYTIIDSMQYVKDGFKIRLFTRNSEAGFTNRKTHYQHLERYNKEYSKEIIIEYPISSLYFPRGSPDEICTLLIDKNIYTWNRMLILDEKAKDKLMQDIWKDISQ
jgi:hypothetical protein